MRSILLAALQLTSFATLGVTRTTEGMANRIPDLPANSGDVQLLDHDVDSAYSRFSVRPDFLTGADESLVFELQVGPTQDLSTSDVVLNDQQLDIRWQDRWTHSYQVLFIPDTTGNEHRVELTWTGSLSPTPDHPLDDNDVNQNIHFRIITVDDIPTHSIGFLANMRPTAERRLLGLTVDADSGSLIEDFDETATHPLLGATSDSDDEGSATQMGDHFNLDSELETLHLLENQAKELQSQIASKKKAISNNLRQYRDTLCVRHLVKECDGIVSAAKAIAQRICAKVGINYEPAIGFAKMHNAHMQHNMASSDARVHRVQAMNMPIMATKDSSVHAFTSIDLVNPPNPLIRLLQVLAAALGLSALYFLIKRKCASARTKVERAADREERRNARAYRRAARRALMRRRWDTFVATFSCFRVQVDPGNGDYEEKRALILQDAFLEQDLDQAEKGELMEAEIRELRHAHEIVASMVRVDDQHYGLAAPLHDPPPPLVPLPFTPVTARSRASTHTLPSYTSESLPDYTSRPDGQSDSSDDDETSSDSLVSGPTPSTSAQDEQRSGVASSESSGRTRYTPTSSVIDMSPRPSEETLRTRPSRDTQDYR